MDDKNIIYILVYAKIILLGFTSIGSILYTLPICLIKKFHTSLNFLSINISITLFLCVVFWAIYFIMNTWYIDIFWTEKSCLLISYLQTTFNCLFIYSTCIASLNRLFAIVYQSKVLFRTKKWVMICISIQWSISIIIPLPHFRSSSQHCFTSGPGLIQQIYSLFIVSILPSIFLIITNIIIFINVHRSTRRVHSMKNDQDQSCSTLHPRDAKLLKHMIFMFVVFFCGWTSIYIVGLVDWSEKDITYVVLHSVAMLPPICFAINIIDLFLYNHELRTYYSNKLRNRCQPST
ncbi:hypothetical protein I4U23_022379 [Adineta vaga]|nr:hypothetical protein I4U23_022379 [Adineta vaga]